MTRISVIIPCYRQARFLPDALSCVSNQTFRDWECIVVDDGSPDDVRSVVDPWMRSDSRFIYLRQDKGGLSSARNLGLRHAKGEFIQFLDADDLIEPEKFTHQLLHIDEGIDVSISGCRYFRDSEGPGRRRILFRDINPEIIIRRDDSVDVMNVFHIRNPFVICAPLYRKRLLDRVGGFDESLHALEDWQFNLRCALEGAVFHHCGYADRTLALVRIHLSSMSNEEERMRANYLRFREWCANDPGYVSRFGIPPEILKLRRRSSPSDLSAKQVVLWFLPPIVVDGWQAVTTWLRSRP